MKQDIFKPLLAEVDPLSIIEHPRERQTRASQIALKASQREGLTIRITDAQSALLLFFKPSQTMLVGYTHNHLVLRINKLAAKPIAAELEDS